MESHPQNPEFSIIWIHLTKHCESMIGPDVSAQTRSTWQVPGSHRIFVLGHFLALCTTHASKKVYLESANHH